MKPSIFEVLGIVILSVIVGTGVHTMREKKTKIPYVGKFDCTTIKPKAEAPPSEAGSGTKPLESTPDGDKAVGDKAVGDKADGDKAGGDAEKLPVRPVVEEDKPLVLGEHEINAETAFRDYFPDGLAVFIDARRTKHFEPGHIPDAISISPWQGDFDEQIEAFLNDESKYGQPVVVYCTGQDCEDSHKVADRLRGPDYPEVLVMKDGFPGWTKRGYPTEKGSEKAE